MCLTVKMARKRPYHYLIRSPDRSFFLVRCTELGFRVEWAAFETRGPMDNILDTRMCHRKCQEVEDM